MSKMKCTTCPQSKKIGFLIVIEGECCSGIPEEFSLDLSLKDTSKNIWTLAKEKTEASFSALPILWKETGTGKEIYRGEEREEEGWRMEDFLWEEIVSDVVDLRLSYDALDYIDMNQKDKNTSGKP